MKTEDKDSQIQYVKSVNNKLKAKCNNGFDKSMRILRINSFANAVRVTRVHTMDDTDADNVCVVFSVS